MWHPAFVFSLRGEQKVLPIRWLATIPLLLRIWEHPAWEHPADTDPLAGLPVHSSLEQARMQTGRQRQRSCPASSDLPGRGHGAPHGTWLSCPTDYGCLWALIRNLIRGPLMFSLLSLSSSSFRNWISREKKTSKHFSVSLLRRPRLSCSNDPTHSTQFFFILKPKLDTVPLISFYIRTQGFIPND